MSRATRTRLELPPAHEPHSLSVLRFFSWGHVDMQCKRRQESIMRIPSCPNIFLWGVVHDHQAHTCTITKTPSTRPLSRFLCTV